MTGEEETQKDVWTENHRFIISEDDWKDRIAHDAIAVTPALLENDKGKSKSIDKPMVVCLIPLSVSAVSPLQTDKVKTPVYLTHHSCTERKDVWTTLGDSAEKPQSCGCSYEGPFAAIGSRAP